MVISYYFLAIPHKLPQVLFSPIVNCYFPMMHFRQTCPKQHLVVSFNERAQNSISIILNYSKYCVMQTAVN